MEKLHAEKIGGMPVRIGFAIMAGSRQTPEKVEECCHPLESEREVERYVEAERGRFREEWFKYLRENGEEDLYY